MIAQPISANRKRLISQKRYYNKRPIEERFWEKVCFDSPDKCWAWKGFKDRRGYAKFYLDGMPEWTHRVAWMLSVGPLDPEMEICHKCDNPSCVNPAHLYQGTHKDNMEDAARRKRFPNRKGERNNRSKLTDSQVAELKQLYANGAMTSRMLANKFSVKLPTVTGILWSNRWGHIRMNSHTA